MFQRIQATCFFSFQCVKLGPSPCEYEGKTARLQHNVAGTTGDKSIGPWTISR